MRRERVEGLSGERSEGVRGGGAEAGVRLLTPVDPSPLTGTSHVSRLTPHAGSVGATLAAAAALLHAAGVEAARREASELYAALVGRPTSAAWLERDAPLAPELAERLLAAAGRRARGWPQAYAAGRANFRGWWLAVDRRVLIPRPETEGLVELALGWIRDAGIAAPCVADVGTGSGAIAVALARESAARVLAIDGSAAALGVARANAAEHRVAERVALVCGHWLAALGSGTVDVLVSNPPYVATGEWALLEPGVRLFEPRTALDGGPDGLGPTRELVAQAWGALRPGGLLAVELDARRARASAELAAAAGFASCVVVEDLSGRPRYLRAGRPADGSD